MIINNRKQLYEVDFSAISEANTSYLDDDIAIVEDMEHLPWISSVRLKFNAFCSCLQGNMEVQVNRKHYTLNPGETFICPSGLIVKQVYVSHDFKFKLLFLTDRIIQSLLSTNVDIWNRAVYVRQEHVARAVSEKQRNIGEHFLTIIHALMERKDNPFREEMMRSLLNIVLLSFCAHQSTIESVHEGPKKRFSQSLSIFDSFIKLLKEEPMKHRPIGYYADKIGVSNKHLSSVCKKVSGKLASELIHATVCQEITAYFINTKLPIKEIAFRLGFTNLSAFGVFVKEEFGVSPAKYRKQLYSEKK